MTDEQRRRDEAAVLLSLLPVDADHIMRCAERFYGEASWREGMRLTFEEYIRDKVRERLKAAEGEAT